MTASPLSSLDELIRLREQERVLGGTGLVAACDDPELFGFELWPKQRELLKVVEAGPRIQVLAWGRRGSKTTMMALVGLWSCLLRPELRQALRPGEVGYAVGIATKRDQAGLMVKAARSIVERSPLLADMVVSSTETELRFSNGTAFTAFPCTSRGVRGWPVFALLMDEVAHFLDTDGNSAAERVWQAFIPSTLQFGSAARVMVGSTPWGDQNLFADLYARAANGELPDAVAHHATSLEVNPTLSEAQLETERQMLGADEFAAEYLADFVSSGGAFLEQEQIRDAVAERGELEPDHASSWVAGLDPAFSSDPFGLALVGQDLERGKLVLGTARRWLPGAVPAGSSFESRRMVEDRVLDEVAEVCVRFGARVVTDQYLAPAVTERLRRAGLSVSVETMTATSKTAAYSELRARLAGGQLELYGQQQLLDELRRLRTKFAAGRSTVLNPRVGDSHGDMAQALALAVWRHKAWSPLRGGAGVSSVPRARLRLPARLGGRR